MLLILMTLLMLTAKGAVAFSIALFIAEAIARLMLLVPRAYSSNAN